MEKRSVPSWGWNSHNLQQSQWLRINLSELDKKTKAMLRLIEDDGDSVARKAKKYCKRRPKLMQMVEEFNRAYRYLAEEYDKLWCGLKSGSLSSTTFSSNSRKLGHIDKIVVGGFDDSKSEAFCSRPESLVEEPDGEYYNTKIDFEFLNSNIELGMTEEMKVANTDVKEDATRKMGGFGLRGSAIGEFPTCNIEQGDTWSELKLQVMKLMEENLQQQAELIRRNDENRETIKELCFQLESLKSENKALQSCLRCSKVDVKPNQSGISKLKGLILGKFFGEGST